MTSAGTDFARWKTNSRVRTPLLCLFIVGVVLAVYWPVVSHEFINYDDPDYVINNRHVRAGVTWDGVFWAFGQLHGEQTYWHPVTWMSHMLDCQIFDVRPAGHHLVNMLWHALDAVLLFLVLKRMTGAFWRGATVALLFALHPLQVDTVAWVAERKNLLSAFFWMLTIWAYARHTERRGPAWYVGALFFFALGLACKPVLVTLPFLLLLLDYWPLGRFARADVGKAVTRLGWLCVEKIPFLVLAALSCGITIAAHRALRGMLDAESGLPLGMRLANAVVSYVRYIGKTVWPGNLAVYYPYPPAWPVWEVAGCALLLIFVSAVAVWTVKERPYIFVGWCWFLGVLVPFIGLVQAGDQAMADRFAYLPIIGLFITAVWLVSDFLKPRRNGYVAGIVIAMLVLTACAIQTRHQLGYWKNSETLFEHALAVTDGNDVAEYALASALSNKGKWSEATEHYENALKLRADYPEAHGGLAWVLVMQRKPGQAIEHYREAIRLNAADIQPRNELASLLIEQGRFDEATGLCEESVRLNPDDPTAHFNLGMIKTKAGDSENAKKEFELCLRADASYAAAQYQMGMLALRDGDSTAAVSCWRSAVRLSPTWVDPLNNLAWVLATAPDSKLRDGAEAVRLATRASELGGTNDVRILDTLAAAYAEGGFFSNAVTSSTRAGEIARGQGRTELAEQIEHRTSLYLAKQAYHEKMPAK